MDETFTFTLDDETEKKLFELLTDVDVSKTPSFGIKDKHRNEAEYVKVVHCKDCKHRMHNKTCTKVMKRKPDDGFCDEGENK